MIMKRQYKIISSVIVLALVFSIALAPASYADAQHQRFAALVGAALQALNITIQSINAPLQDAYNFLSDPLGVTYTYSEQQLDQYFDRSLIHVWDNYIEIDGVQYTDVWFGNEIAETFRVNAGDIETAWNISSNSAGSYASGVGIYEGVPIFNVNGIRQSQRYSFNIGDSFVVGNKTFTSRNGTGTQVGQLYIGNNAVGYYYPYSTQQSCAGAPSYFQYYDVNSDCTSAKRGAYLAQTHALQPYTSSITGTGQSLPFSYDWVAGTIPADPIPTQDTGLKIRVPAEDLETWVTDNPSFGLPGGATIDMSDPDIVDSVHDLLDILVPIIPIIPIGDITFSEDNEEEPVPDPNPDPIPLPDATVLPNVPWENLKHQIDRVVQHIQSIPSTIQPFFDDIIQTISDLGDTILQDIEIGPIRIFDGAINILRDLFLPFFSGLSSAIGIWHYVVDWISSISAPFVWFLAMSSGTSAVILGPVYAAIAGTIVIAVYRRFGR